MTLLDIFDPKAPPPALGIDLGTTHSVVAHVRDERPVALDTCDGTALLPSVVHYGDHGAVLVGAAARRLATEQPERTLASVKRYMGRGARDAEAGQLTAHRLAPAASDDDARVVRFALGGGRTVTPVEVSAEILRSLARSARDHLGGIGGVVITVPAYFDDAQRQATRDAGRLAGLDVLRLLAEPTAAALAYGLDSGRSGTFAVYDLGGGTFDVTILALEDGVFQVRATGGDSALGGDDMDRAIAEELLAAMGATTDAARAPAVVAVALAAARDLKHALTTDSTATTSLPARGGGDITFTLERPRFEELVRPLLERTGRACRRALRDAGLEPSSLDGVILVGGATRVPCVRAYVAELFGQAPLADIDPDRVVAYGAALQADLLARASDEVLLLDVIPLSLGVETLGGAVDRVLPRNTTLPAGARSTFTTYADGQTGFEIHVVQGERELAADCRSLARFSLRGIPPMPAGMARLEVTFDVDENGLLTVRARETTTGIEQSVTVRPSHGLTDDEVEAMLVAALDHGEEDLARRRLVDARVEGSRIALATEKGLEADGDLLGAEERAQVEERLRALRTSLEASGTASAVQARIDALDDATHAWAGRRMDRAVAAAIAGRGVAEVEQEVRHARGVESHVAEHSGAVAEEPRP
ncbi:MAG: Fe-S protein assembly chaperone HscA [Polyangiaceae bacterium]|nr:Fe-S protein assembly chaperone HscA [Polyangiaceae bacterium]